MTQWGLNPLNNTIASYASFAFPSFEAQETQGELTISVESDNRNVIFRFFGCLIMGMMPERGLPEALETLGDMYMFYQEEANEIEPPKRLTSKVKANVIAERERPELVIS